MERRVGNLHLDAAFGQSPDEAYHLRGDPGEIGLGAPRGSITDREGDILADSARGKRVLEIGTGTGYSASRMLETCAALTTIDIDPWVIETVFPELEKLGARCLESPPEGEIFDVVFIDGSHEAGAVTKDYETAIACTEPGAQIFFHDLHLGGVKAAIAGLGIATRKLGTLLHLAVLERD